MLCGGPKSLPVHRYTVVIFTFSGPLGLMGSTLLFGNRAAFNAGLGGVRDVACVIISNEQTQSNRVCCFDAVFPHICTQTGTCDTRSGDIVFFSAAFDEFSLFTKN